MMMFENVETWRQSLIYAVSPIHISSVSTLPHENWSISVETFLSVDTFTLNYDRNQKNTYP